MSENPQNPPIFPGSTKTIHFGDRDIIMQEGMLLRDYFAGQALTGFMTIWRDTSQSYTPGMLAKEMYEIADAMLAARESTPK